uniref:histidine kinase n=1 Tax=Chromera velia CCMP2878 TaxID=1169474 RepID=A0A0G4I624_9ALVE|eukprot:Cvel_11252.t1-p1 / transcript=Cvel_11252.t1 / gene=Cvel_11252 / organism=Chromera_velia_CCMP2878 / gene_product=hypothetical protein / transcript_product=hypothetical protein / location=Cvel_scaffold701:42109-45426(-) / protein_length=831 / sequence_SO=supercontig / SO=protein_coding / is_pseudo=false
MIPMGQGSWIDVALTVCAVVSLAIALSPERVAKREQLTSEVRETAAFWGLLGFVVFFRLMLLVWSSSPLVFLYGHGMSAFVMKLFVMNLHIPERHFMMLNVTDSLLWVVTGLYRFRALEDPSEVSGFALLMCPLPFLFASSLRQLLLRALADAGKEVNQRQNAEHARAVLLSYIMHEMRNPLSGASLLVYEFVESLKELRIAARERQTSHHTLRRLMKKEAVRLQELASFMSTQLDKMKGVCDDVLQLEKIQNGKFEFQFTPQPLIKWVKMTVSQSAPLFTNPYEEDKEAAPGGAVRASRVTLVASSEKKRKGPMVKFRWALDLSSEVQAVLEARPVGVADFSRLEQVVSNFLSNAKKFTTEGEVVLKFEVKMPAEWGDGGAVGVGLEGSPPARRAIELISGKAKNDEGGTGQDTSEEKGKADLLWVLLRVSVTDSGAGLSEEDRGHLFRPYGQVRAGELQNGGGTGLGLCICKSFVDAHPCGRVGVESPGRGQGSTFFFEIFVPILDSSVCCSSLCTDGLDSEVGSPSPQSCRRTLPDRTERRETILSLFSDESAMSGTPLDRRLLLSRGASRSQLSSDGGVGTPSEGATPVGTETDGEDEIASRYRLGENDDAAQLSVQSGREMASQASRSEGEGGGKAGGEEDSSSREWSEERSPATASGSIWLGGSPTAVVASPCSEGSYADTKNAAQRREGKQRVTADVLLVDDDRLCLLAGSAVLRRLGFSVQTAEDGDEAVELVVGQKGSFRFILIDKNMARMEGPEAVRQFVAHFTTESVQNGSDQPNPRPLIFGCTGDATPEAHSDFLTAGADRVVFKPLQAEELARVLKKS